MVKEIGPREMAAMLERAAESIRANQAELSQLDSHGGDGDHGTTMARAMVKMQEALDKSEAGSLQQVLKDVGWGIMGVDGGATGPLLGTLFMSMSKAVGDCDALDAERLAEAFEAGMAGMAKRTKARPGDKTLVDALDPAVAALRQAASDGVGVPEAMRRAADAAAEGARATAEMQARFGRSRNIGEKSIGFPDAGATSMSLIFKGFSDALAD